MDKIWFATITEIGTLLRRRELSPVELTRTMLSRIEKLDGRLHSYITVAPGLAIEQAQVAESEIARGIDRGPLHGVPIGIKDICFTKGIPTTCSSLVLSGWKPDFDATVVTRLREAGAVTLGKLNLTEFALSGYSPGLPIPLNPWNANLHPGLSSSGSGVATASGLCFGSLGTDTGGSIRYPSAWNGVVGLKPTYGRVSRHGVFPLAASLDHIGPITRSVADAAAMLDAIAGHDPADPTSRRTTAPACSAAIGKDLRGLRIGYDAGFVGDATQADVVEALLAALRVLADLGADIVDVNVPSVEAALPEWSVLCSADALVAHAATFPSRAGDYGPTFRSFLELGASLGAGDYARGHQTRLEFAQSFQQVFETADVLVCPSALMTAPPAVLIDPYAPFTNDFSDFGRFTVPFDFSGNPTLSLPSGFTEDGMPHSMQLVGAHLAEAMLCRVGHAYEQATPWHARHPSVD